MGQLTSTGYVRKTQQEFRDEIFARWRDKPSLGSDFLDSPEAPQTGFAETVAEMLADMDEAVASAHAVTSRGSAVGKQLDDIGDLIGVPRRLASKSTVTATVSLNDGVTLPLGSQAASSIDSTAVYATAIAIANDTGAPADFTVTMAAVETGTGYFVAAGNLTSIVTPITGWTAVTNATDSTLGTTDEKNADYRARQVLQLAVAGTGTVDAIRSAVSAVDGVTSVTVISNDRSYPTQLGIPPSAFEVIVFGGADNAVAQAIWDNKAIGAQSYGGTPGTAVDQFGANQTVMFSRPVEVPIWIAITVTTDSNYAGNTAFRSALAQDLSAFFGLGDDVVFLRIAALALEQPGVVDVTGLLIGVADPASGGSNLVLPARAIADFDTSRISVTS